MRPVRLGAVGYLNARPLVYGLEHSPEFDLRFDVPSRCADLLHAGGIDLGLIPSVEYARQADRGYRIVPGPAIVSEGPVASVTLYARRPLNDVRSIALDASSRTSVALLQVLCARAFRIAPEFRPHPPDLAAMLDANDAALLIGDPALFQEEPVPGVIDRVDLGEAWTRLTGLPFVYAFWAGPDGAARPSHVRALCEARDLGVARSDEIARSYAGEEPGRRGAAARYLRDNIRYYLGAAEQAGLDRFMAYAAEAGLVPPAGRLRFFAEGESLA